MKNPTRVAFFISGSGSTMQAAIQAIQMGHLKGLFPVIAVSSNGKAQGVKKAQALGITTKIIDRKNFNSPDDFGRAILALLKKSKIDIVSNNGWLPYIPKNVIDIYDGRMINQHPGPLDPGRGIDFGGAGMYGTRVLAARMIYEWTTGDNKPWTEATVHYVTEDFDDGDLINTQMVSLPKPKQKVSITNINNNETLKQYIKDEVINFQKEFLPIEHSTVITALQLFAWGEKPDGFRRKTPLIPDKKVPILEDAKRLAIELFPNG